MDDYDCLEVIGEGTGGTVYRCIHKHTKQVVALKRMRSGDLKEGIPFSALREIKFLRELSHPRIVSLYDVFSHGDNIYLAFEFLQTDLDHLIHNKTVVLTPSHIKAYMRMLLEGLKFLHSNFIFHRDVKPGNLLLSSTGELKITDFGLARTFGSPHKVLSGTIATIWYRAPEILYGARFYGPAIDLWAVGCIFVELMTRRPLFPGNSDLDQLNKIFSVVDPPTNDSWPDVTLLPSFVPTKPSKLCTLQQIVPPFFGEDALDLVTMLLTANPNTRITAEKALDHRYFTEGVLATPINELPFSTRAPDTTPGTGSETVGRRLGFLNLDTPRTEKTPLNSEQISMSRSKPPTISSVDRAFLRQRKLDLDAELTDDDEDFGSPPGSRSVDRPVKQARLV
ncbi:hypothetical protein GEMRC1_007340 [Eukaryota sp. GEM-RC1]